MLSCIVMLAMESVVKETEPAFFVINFSCWHTSDVLVCFCGQVSGVVDCIPDAEKSGLLCRQEHLGFDRHGRKYWFLARRIFVYVHVYILYNFICH